MVSINYAAREVCCKIVYYGPGLSGKTTNLQYVHAKVPGNSRGKLISLATEADRTLYFDFLPINIGTINGFQAKFQLYTVPGQVYYNATRKLVLRGVDGVVFVADSQPDKMDENIESLFNLEENLKEYGYDPNTLPMVIQFNKRDLPGVLPVEVLNQQLNKRGWPHFEASATVGNGVFDTLKLIIKLVLDKAKSSQTGAKKPAARVIENPQATQAPAPMPIPPAMPQAAHQPIPQPQPTYQTPTQAPTAAEIHPIAATHQSSGVAVQEQPTQPTPPAEPEAPAYRPFPGSKGGTQPVPTSKTTRPSMAPPVEAKPVTTSSNANGPQMAPPLKRRDHKKRGFFRRLFGI